MISWPAAPERPEARPDEVQVWGVALTRPPEEVGALRRLLADEELARADAFRFARHRDNFIVARGTLRVILGRYLRLAPAALGFDYNAYGKPALGGDAGANALRFNLSHAGEVALYAVASGREVGVDVEEVREDVACLDLAKHFFSEHENAALGALPPEAQRRGFFNCWTRKEAYIKARGKGLSIPLDSFDVSLAPGEPAALLCTREEAQQAANWTLRAIEPGEGYVAAVAAKGSDWRPRCWRFPA